MTQELERLQKDRERATYETCRILESPDPDPITQAKKLKEAQARERAAIDAFHTVYDPWLRRWEKAHLEGITPRGRRPR